MKALFKTQVLFAFYIFLFLISETASSQNFTWVTGTTTPNALGIYGTQGLPSTANTPGARRSGATWTDLNGNLWLFGGEGYGQFISGYNYLNDLWRYNPTTNEWTFMQGSPLVNQPSAYGTPGIAAPGNRPGGKKNALTWVDPSGNLWLYGGMGYYGTTTLGGTNYLNDLWKYNITTNQWTFYSGCIGTSANQYAVYGTLGVANSSNLSGQRLQAVGWSDATGSLWMFSGMTVGSSQFGGGVMNDLWKYNTATNQFTWMKGSNQPTNAMGVFGSQGFPSSSNTPGGHQDACSFKDAAWNFWFYGGWGQGNSTTSTGLMSDLWKFDPTTNNWTWMKGSGLPNQLANYSPIGVATGTAQPGGRDMHKGWTDAAGNFWLFAGRGYGSASSFSNYMSDLWKYNVSNNQWTLMKGSNLFDQLGVYGTQGIAAPNNMPGSRQEYMSWTDLNGRLWLFGGIGRSAGASGLLNDFWRYDVCYTPPTPTNISLPANQLICSGNGSTLTVNSTTGSMQWFSSPTSTSNLSSGFTFLTPTLTTTTTFYAEGITCGPSASRTAITITVNPLPQIVVYGGGICTGNSFTFNPSGAATYTYSSGSSITSPTSTSVYTVSGTSTAGCLGAPATVTITVANNLSVSINGSNVTCAGDPLNLIAGGASTYSWNTGMQTNTLSGNPFTNITYTVTGFSGTCATTAIHSVTVKPVPFININSGAVCIGFSYTINPTGAATYTYMNGGPVISPLVNTAYSVAAKGLNGCISPTLAIASITVNSLPIINTNASASNICEGSSVTLNGSGANTYTWTGGVLNSVPFTPSATSTYSVYGTDTITGCKSVVPSVRSIIVKPAPNITTNIIPGAICAGESATLEATGASAYLWNTGEATPSIIVLDTISKTYSLTGTGSNNCTKTVSLQLIVNACTGLKENNLNQAVELYPNPCSNKFRVICPVGYNQIELILTNTQGRIVQKEKLKAGVNDIKTSLESALYFYTVLGDGISIGSGKLIVE